MKQILKLLIFKLIFLNLCFSEDLNKEFSLSYDNFLKEYKFLIYFGNKNVGYINVRISSFVYNDFGDYMLYSEINSYTEIPILFFLGNTQNYEIEQYDKNFLPLNSTMITLENEQEETTTVTEIKHLKNGLYECLFKKTKKKTKTKRTTFKPPILTAGNAIPLVSTLWDFEKVKEIEFKFIDKERLVIDTLRFSYDGETQQGLIKVRLFLPYLNVRFTIYLDKNKNIVYAEGLGLKIYAIK